MSEYQARRCAEPQPTHRPRRSKRRNSKLCHIPGCILSGALLIVMALFGYTVLYSQMVPTKFVIVLFLLLIAILVLLFLLLWDTRNKGRFVTGTILTILLGALLIYGSVALLQTVGALNSITTTKTEVAQVTFYVNDDDPAQTIDDAQDYTFGILTALDRTNTDLAIEQVNETLGRELNTQEFDGLTDLIDALRDHTIGAIVLNSAYLDLLDEHEGYETVSEELRAISVAEVTQEIPVDTTEVGDDATVSDDGVYTIFISGIDTRGDLTAKSRSDVNIIATVNTNTHQVLLLSTPRDYYVPLSISNGVPDKLTHAGIYGINVSMDTLEMLYDINIDYYFRVNFSGFQEIINALGGVNVYSDYSFTSIDGYSYSKGYNYLDGAEALSFARERKAFAEGDNQRGKNQMAVIKAVINKCLSPELLRNYSSILTSIEGNFETSIPYDLIAYLVRDQLDTGAEWNISSYSVTGTGDSRVPYSMSQKAYVMIPDEDTVATAKELMRQVRDGEDVVIPES
jgi:LCP family protein required for cell wall assembly